MEEFFELQKKYEEEFKKFAHTCFEIIKKFKLSANDPTKIVEKNIDSIEQFDKHIAVRFSWTVSGEPEWETVTILKSYFCKDIDKEFEMYLNLKDKFEK